MVSNYCQINGVVVVFFRDAEKMRRKMLADKLLFGIFGGGKYWQYILVFNWIVRC